MRASGAMRFGGARLQTGLPELGRVLARTPAVLPLTAALAAIVWLVASNGGFAPSSWYGTALFLFAVLALMAFVVPSTAGVRGGWIAIALLLGFSAWCFLTMAWAEQPAYAWEGANRALMYAFVLGLFSIWRLRAGSAAFLVGGFAVGVGVLGLIELLRAAASSHPQSWFAEAQLSEPVGYHNADAALWTLAFWPAVVLAARREVAPVLRGVLAASGVVLGALALMAQSRGWLFALPIAAIVFVVLVPARVRSALTLLLVTAGVAASAPAVLHVYNAGRADFAGAVDSAAIAVVVAAAVTGVAAALLALADRRTRPSVFVVRRTGAVLVALTALACVAGLVVWTAEKGDPVSNVRHAWHDFKTKQRANPGSSRFAGSLGSHRYDFWRVALDRFAANPVAGTGADNFQQDYLRLGRSYEQPRFPHSLELGTLSETGLMGAALLFGALALAIGTGVVAARRRTGLGAAVAAAGVVSFAYWIAHGSVDWFWEFPGLGAAAFALLGIAVGLRPRTAGPFGPPLLAGRGRPLAASVVVAIIGVNLAAPWLAELYSDRGASTWQGQPRKAFDDLDAAASLNPLSARPKLLAGSIALRLGDPNAAQRYFREALDRDGRDAYAHLELGAIASQQGRRGESLAYLQQAHSLAPRDDITSATLDTVRAGRRVSVQQLNTSILGRTQKLAR
jgi:hypothetical protein